MRVPTTSLFLGILCATACTSTAQNEQYASGPTWPLGHFQLVSFNGRKLPVELPNGQILREGHCTLLERRAGGMGFSMNFIYGGKPRVPRDLAPRILGGEVVIQANVQGAARKPVRFLIESRGEFEDLDWGTVRYSVEEEAPGTLFGNELRMGGEGEALVFMRRPDPRRRWR